MLFRVLAVFALVALPFMAAGAAELKLNYQAVMHISKSEALPVLDNKKHLMGVGAFRGIAIFPGDQPGDRPGDQIVRHEYDGWFDLLEGSGPFHGYVRWRFSDGSTLSARYDGAVKVVAADDAEVSATIRDFTVTGRFEGVKDQGSFAGRRFEPVTKGGTTYLKGSLTLQTGN